MTLSPSWLEGLWLGHDVRPETARPLADWPLIVLVGVTGVGKSTALAALKGPTLSGPTLNDSTLGGPGLRILPDRRQVTDAVMIWPQVGRAVQDREERFALTARYREQHPGGMAQALGELWADPLAGEQLVFDGLRGLNEVQYAAEAFAAWRFINLHAPDALRVRRLLGRGDAFDNAGGTLGGDLRAALAALPGAAQVLTPGELSGLAALTAEGHLPQDILAKTRIVLSERRNYDPAAARAFLLTLPPERVLDLDTAALSPAEVARRVGEWL